MLRRRSIRFRLTAWYALVLTAGLGLFSVLVWLALRQQLLADLDHDLEGRALRLENYFRAESAEAGVSITDELDEFCQALPETSYVALSGSNGFHYGYPKYTRPPVPSRTLHREFTFNKEVFRIDLGTPVEDVVHVLDRLRLLMLGLLPAVIAMACVGGAWLSGRALKPVRNMIAAAHTISIENLSQRLPVPATGDEVADLTEVLNSMLERLDSAVAILTQFAADASHELRTPLAVIRTTAELALRRGRTPESYRESLESIVAEVARMTQLVEDLLMLARTDKALAEIQPAPVDLTGILEDVCSEMSNLAAARGVTITKSFGQEPVLVCGSASMLHRLVVLLLDNAIKYSGEHREVAAKLEATDSSAVIAIEDHGAGIAATDLPHIFQRFFRANQGRGGDGHGLGLPLAESIARAHQAHIEVQSSEGIGSTFRVRFSRVWEKPVTPRPTDIANSQRTS